MNDSLKNKRKFWADIFKQLSWLTQLGLSIIMPTLLCVLICAYLCTRYNIGGWIFIPGFILGLGASFTTGYNFYISESKKSEKESKERRRGFNSHV